MMKKHVINSKDSLKCEICWENDSKHCCKICGRKVCEEDFNKERGICKVCEMSICQLCQRNLAIGYCECCGRLVCIECTAYHDKSRRICKECFQKIQKPT
ncbi:hypothetical protein IC006_1117 [Sulfuracidifex tepidarius]|uniref:B box-type domain-containing protein n=1 Tax=Sulfuracidifex tepidarius TaxID=1294262 RepID=A0A510DUC4_9CREN|nr:hypothetical protein IC006_1117 [Sulfuracidifex tepidarius]BBG26577.1 hypothetical protein IC007_1092 [Sulfuracidifex tepidarius]